MPVHRQTTHSPYTCRQLYDLVVDIEAYPRFLPWCVAARVLSREPAALLAELVISFKAFRESYVSRVALTPPAAEHTPAAVDVTMVRGPFEHLVNHWRFTPSASGNGTDIDFMLDFAFKSRVLEKLIGGLFTRATQKMVEAFETRADALYGSKTA